MNESRHDKGSVPSVIAAYRKRQERALRLLVISWIAVMLLILGAGYLIYRFFSPRNVQQAEITSETPTASGTFAADIPDLNPPADTPAAALEQTETPVASATLDGPRMIRYTVKEGDTLASIAVQHGIGLADLIALNPLVTPEYLSVGDQLSISVQGDSPSTATQASSSLQSMLEYQVIAGDTLAAIAARFGSTVTGIVQENNLESPDQIFVGQSLRIPVEGEPPLTPTPDSLNSTPDTPVPPSP